MIASMRSFVDAGHATIGLNVDVTSSTGAQRVYERLGFVTYDYVELGDHTLSGGDTPDFTDRG